MLCVLSQAKSLNETAFSSQIKANPNELPPGNPISRGKVFLTEPQTTVISIKLRCMCARIHMSQTRQPHKSQLSDGASAHIKYSQWFHLIKAQFDEKLVRISLSRWADLMSAVSPTSTALIRYSVCLSPHFVYPISHQWICNEPNSCQKRHRIGCWKFGRFFFSQLFDKGEQNQLSN